MPRKSNGSGSIYQRGNIWWVKIRVNGKLHYESSKSEKKGDAVALRDRLLSQRHRGEIGGMNPTIGNLLDDLEQYAKVHIRKNTAYTFHTTIEAHIRPFFSKLRVQRLTSKVLSDYRSKREVTVCPGTVNRELSILRLALNNGRKTTPPKVALVPYFPMVPENNARSGFLSDDEYKRLMQGMPDSLKALVATAYQTGIRRGDLLALCWDQVNFDELTILLEITKNGQARIVPIIAGDMERYLREAFASRDEQCSWVFQRWGRQILDFRIAWAEACKEAGVPDLHFHDLRRTAVRNMRRAGVSQGVRMKISGHKTDSMERRYNIIDTDDLQEARRLMEARNAQTVTATVTMTPDSGVFERTQSAKKPHKRVNAA